MAKSWSAKEASLQPAFMGSCMTICQTCLQCPPSGQIWLYIGGRWGREKCLVQHLERGICPGSVLDCSSRIKQTVKFGTQHLQVAWWLWCRPPTALVRLPRGTKNILPCCHKIDVYSSGQQGASRGCVLVASADSWRKRENIKALRGENFAVDYCSQILEHEGSMSLASLHGSGMCPESILDCD